VYPGQHGASSRAADGGGGAGGAHQPGRHPELAEGADGCTRQLHLQHKRSSWFQGVKGAAAGYAWRHWRHRQLAGKCATRAPQG
jgi:hypothetical protein